MSSGWRKPLKFYACPHICPHKIGYRKDGPKEGENPLKWCFVYPGFSGNTSHHTDSKTAHPHCSDVCRALRANRKSRDANDTEIKTWLPWLSAYAFESDDTEKKEWYIKYGETHPRFSAYIFTKPPATSPPLHSLYTDGRTGIPSDSTWFNHYNHATLLLTDPPPPPRLAEDILPQAYISPAPSTPSSSKKPTPKPTKRAQKPSGRRVCFVASDRYELRFVPGKTIQECAQDMVEKHRWIKQEIHSDSNEVFLNLMKNKAVHRLFISGETRDEREVKTYYLFEWLLLVAKLCTDNWNVELMSWASYRDALISRNGPDWQRLLSSKLVLGGRDISNDMAGLRDTGINPANLKDYLVGATELENRVAVWPSASDLIDFGRKLSIHAMLETVLNRIDGKVLRYQEIVSKEVGKTLLLQSDSCVIKREFSSGGEHIIVPTRDSDAVGRFERMWDQTELYYASLPKELQPRFFSVPFFPDIVQKGEAHCYTHNGELIHVVHTAPKTEQTETGSNVVAAPISGCVPLSQIRQGRKEKGVFDREQDEKGWVLADTLPQQELESGYAELTAFVKSVVAGLIEVEEEAGRKPSPLRFFCRIDIAPIFNPEIQQYQYVVKKIARNMCGLFASEFQPTDLISRMVGSLERILISERVTSPQESLISSKVE